MTFQTRLLDANGSLVSDGLGSELDVRIWSAATGGTFIWGQRYSGIQVRGGAVSILLGANGGVNLSGAQTTILADAFTAADRFIGVTRTKNSDGGLIAAPQEILPRQQIFSTPFAFRAETAAKVLPDGVDSSSIKDGSVQMNDLSAALQTQINQLMPPGSVMAYAGMTVPPGWLKCDGSLVSRTQYASLFSAIGTAHGIGDGTATFNLPDYRGRFLRGVNETATEGAGTRDPDAAARTTMAPGGNTGNTVGSVQLDELKNHSHRLGNPGYSAGGGAAGAPPVNTWAVPAGEGQFSTLSTGGKETRPKNAYVSFLIKF
jgi:phage-related tail fiber protein